MSSMKPTLEQIETLRDLFMQKCEKEPAPCGSFHPKDLERVKTSNYYLEKYLEHNDLDMKLSLQLLWDILVWRKNFGANEINESNIRMDYLNQGLIFPRNKDKEGKPLIIFKAKLHTKGSKDMKELMRVVVYWIERIQAENDMDKMTAFFDMQGTSVGNVDMDLIKNIIEIFKLYPLPLNYILIYELPWLLNAAFKLIKSLMPPKAVQVMKFLNPKTVGEFVDDENRLACWGNGKDNYTFKFEPAKPRPKTPLISQVEKFDNNKEDEVNSSMKKVHFANSSPSKVPMSDAEELMTPNNEDMLRITPSDAIVLNRTEDCNEGELRGSVSITCTSKYAITYKIKTTSPLKFRVRPSSGALNPGCTVTVYVILQPDKQISVNSKDKFLVMCTQLPDDFDAKNDLLPAFWKMLPPNSPNVQQHRLQCVVYQDRMRNGHTPDDSTDFADRPNETSSDLVQMSRSLQRIEQQMKLSTKLHWLSFMVFIIVSIGLMYIIKQEIRDQNSDSCPSTGSRF